MNITQIAHKYLGDKLLPVADRLARANELFHTLEYVTANMGIAHKIDYTDSEATTANYEIGEGLEASVTLEKSEIKPLGRRGTAIKIPVDTLDHVFDIEEIKSQKQEQSIAKLARDYAYDFFYSTGGLGIEGLLSHATYNTVGRQVIDNSGSATRSSLWVVNFGPAGSGGVYVATAPGCPMGITSTGWKETTLATTTGKEDEFLYNKIKIVSQLIVENPRNVCRVANINVNEADSSANIDALIANVIKATNRPDQKDRLVIFANNDVISKLEVAKALQSNSYHNPDQFGGTGVVKTFKGIPVAAVDVISSAEAAVS